MLAFSICIGLRKVKIWDKARLCSYHDLYLGGVVLAMRYTEKEYKFEYGSMTEWLQDILGIICIAPLRLCNEISTKIVYLKKSIIERVLFVAVFIQIIVVMITTIIERAIGTVDLFTGKVPLLLQLIVLVILCAGAFTYKINELAIYSHLNALLPIVGSNELVQTVTSSTSVDSVKDTTGCADSTADNIATELDLGSLFDFETSAEIPDIPVEKSTDFVEFVDLDNFNLDDETKQLVNKEIFTDENVIEFQTNNKEIEKIVDSKDDTSVAMDSATDESKYIPEQNLGMFLQKIGADSFSSLENWEVPNDFSLLN